MLTRDSLDINGTCRLLSFRRHLEITDDNENAEKSSSIYEEIPKNLIEKNESERQSRSRCKNISKKYERKNNKTSRSSSIGSSLDLRNSRFIKYVPSSLRRVLSTSFISLDQPDFIEKKNDQNSRKIFQQIEDNKFNNSSGIIPISYQVFDDDDCQDNFRIFKQTNNDKINSWILNDGENNDNCILLELKSVKIDETFIDESAKYLALSSTPPPKLSKRNDEKSTRRDLQRANILRRRKFAQRSFSVPVS